MERIVQFGNGAAGVCGRGRDDCCPAGAGSDRLDEQNALRKLLAQCLDPHRGLADAVGALLLDIFDLWMFRRRVQSSVLLFDLDNVHTASCVYAVLRQRGIDCCLQGFHHRRLLFHFGAAIKISLYVPAADADAARKALPMDEFGAL
jgi:hypothetical protein